MWSELDPDLFRPFSIPFQLSGDTKVLYTVHIIIVSVLETTYCCNYCRVLQANPCDLPTKYREALDRRKKLVTLISSLLLSFSS